MSGYTQTLEWRIAAALSAIREAQAERAHGATADSEWIDSKLHEAIGVLDLPFREHPGSSTPQLREQDE